jgi:hypothetical protein
MGTLLDHQQRDMDTFLNHQQRDMDTFLNYQQKQQLRARAPKQLA